MICSFVDERSHLLFVDRHTVGRITFCNVNRLSNTSSQPASHEPSDTISMASSANWMNGKEVHVGKTRPVASHSVKVTRAELLCVWLISCFDSTVYTQSVCTVHDARDVLLLQSIWTNIRETLSLPLSLGRTLASVQFIIVASRCAYAYTSNLALDRGND